MLRKLIYVFCALSLFVASCKHDPPVPVTSIEDNYPEEVAKIIVTKCAVSGCHNAASYTANGGLLLDTWEHMFQGGSNGAAVVPYSTDFSPLLYFINTDSSLGVVSTPRMPDGQGAQPLSKDEYLTISNWIASGAPDKKGNIPFAADASTRQKVYLTQQGCDLVSVIDAKSKLVMRVLKVGTGAQITDVPHSIRVSENGKYAFVSFNSSGAIQRIDATTDVALPYEKITSVGPNPQWNILHPNREGNKLMVSDFTGGAVRYIDYENSANSKLISGLSGAHGIASVPTFDTFYITAQTGNIVYKLNTHDWNVDTLTLDNNAPTTQSSLDPHEIMMSPDNSKLIVTCQRSGDVRIIDRATKNVKVVSVGLYPQEIAISKRRSAIFITCQEDNPHKVANASYKGSVHVIDLNSLEKITVINGDFAGCHGVTVDDQNGLIYVASRNVAGSGITPHHTTSCGGSNGYYNVFDLNTFAPAPNKRYEVTPDPYSLDTRFK